MVLVCYVRRPHFLKLTRPNAKWAFCITWQLSNFCFWSADILKSSALNVQIQFFSNFIQMIFVSSSKRIPHLIFIRQKSCLLQSDTMICRHCWIMTLYFVGIVELVTESDTLRKIQVSSGVTGSFKDRPIKEWLQKHNPTELEYQKVSIC